jgi:hypothetical protein
LLDTLTGTLHGANYRLQLMNLNKVTDRQTDGHTDGRTDEFLFPFSSAGALVVNDFMLNLIPSSLINLILFFSFF